LKQKASAGSAARLHAEERAVQLQLDLFAPQSSVETLNQENEKLSSKVRRLTKRVVRFEREVKQASLMLHRLSPAATYVENEDIQQ
jgi:predicted RNase H-like nuclease (RuvC/YqgF family)